MGGPTARSVLLSALKEYDDPEAALYQGRESLKNLSVLFQNLRIVICGLGWVGATEDAAVLDQAESGLDGLAALNNSERDRLAIQRLKD